MEVIIIICSNNNNRIILFSLIPPNSESFKGSNTYHIKWLLGLFSTLHSQQKQENGLETTLSFTRVGCLRKCFAFLMFWASFSNNSMSFCWCFGKWMCFLGTSRIDFWQERHQEYWGRVEDIEELKELARKVLHSFFCCFLLQTKQNAPSNQGFETKKMSEEHSILY